MGMKVNIYYRNDDLRLALAYTVVCVYVVLEWTQLGSDLSKLP